MSVGLLGLVAVIRLWLQWVGELPGDRYAAAQFTTPWTEPPVVRWITSFFSALGAPLVAVALGFAGFLLLLLRTDRRTICGLVVACLVVPLNALLKSISGPTPLWSESHQHAGLNFPSGHVAFVTAVIGYLTLIALRQRRVAGAVVGALIIIGIGPARVVAGTHLVSDVIAGYLVGGAVLVLAVAVAPAGQEPARARQRS